MRYLSNLGERYSPLYFLSAVGSGGLTISFFMYLMWMPPHKGSPVANFALVTETFNTGALAMKALIVGAVVGIIIFSVLRFRLLFWNFIEFARWKNTQSFIDLKNSNAESQLMTIPLALAMSINVAIIAGAVLVPGLCKVCELLLPLTLLAFASAGVLGFRIYLDFFSRVVTQGGYDCAKNNSLGQMVSVFAFAMIGVGFSAPAAMSHTKVIAAIGTAASALFIGSAIVLETVKLILGFRSMMEHKAAGETTPTLWIIIPFLTVVGIAIFRIKMSLAHNLDTPVTAGGICVFLISLFAIQILFALIGWSVMKRVGYYDRWIAGPDKSPGSYALVCPGVALVVFANFVINAGLVQLGVVGSM
ncbi:hypothetical protein PsAD2_04084 [Pseudovibrio axinellae]|uniref:Uncharacterized protein n=1 Tax=Pseudovibrio axinellae TaxID=989403 RepID=A0A161V0Q9_9HYPH|nr:hypothetical protein [Pseudovibrio axinellae]KZL09482.1 hypothetical protein PsAD2_04084 [Pseudovibrio axinellae]SEQ63472.1 hypothetical protein SAMN05421798_103291 [Pseudovibrio axinellae]